jgi:two-component sensor histidine kinase
MGRHFSLFYTPEDRQNGKPAQALAEAEATGRFEIEALRLRKDGSTFWANVVIDAIFDEGSLVGFAKITRDITERKKAEEELRASHVEVEHLTRALADKDVLLREVNHRVKNNLQIICSLLDMQTVKVRDPAGREAIKETADRVRAMGLIHHALYDQENASAIAMQDYLGSLCDQISRTLGVEQRGISVEVQAADASFELSTAVPLALIANEVITNAIKHAFPDSSPGRVTVALQQAGPDRWELAVADTGESGQAIPPLDRARSTGFQIVRALTRQLGGDARFEQRNGTTFRLSFPALQTELPER